MKFLLKQPLLHFLLIGLGLFLLYDLTSSQSSENFDLKTVIVDKDDLLTFMQYRSKAFDRQRFEEKLENMSQEELDRLIDDYVHEEVLYREAVGLGLNKNDYVIRKRLVQKVEFINQRFVDSVTDLSDENIKNFFNENKEAYFVEPYVTFTHVFFDKETHGSEMAEKLANEKLSELNRNKVSFTDSTGEGDRFLYHKNYVERTPDYVKSHFGADMAEELFRLEPSNTVWHGPYESPYGYHLVMLTSNKTGRYPEFKDVLERVQQDAEYEHNKRKNEEIIKDIIDSYDIRIVYDRKSEDSKSEKEIPLSKNLTRNPSNK